MHSYRADESFKRDATADDVPVARRTKGWRFLLASAKELEHVEIVVVDGEAIVKRVLEELIDLQSFDEKAYECIGSSSKDLHERICEPCAYLQKLTGEAEPCIPGVPRSVVAKLVAAKLASEAEEGSEEEEWGDLHEAGWKLRPLAYQGSVSVHVGSDEDERRFRFDEDQEDARCLHRCCSHCDRDPLGRTRNVACRNGCR